MQRGITDDQFMSCYARFVINVEIVNNKLFLSGGQSVLGVLQTDISGRSFGDISQFSAYAGNPNDAIAGGIPAPPVIYKRGLISLKRFSSSRAGTSYPVWIQFRLNITGARWSDPPFSENSIQLIAYDYGADVADIIYANTTGDTVSFSLNFSFGSLSFDEVDTRTLALFSEGDVLQGPVIHNSPP
jgi:hypothetical protein